MAREIIHIVRTPLYDEQGMLRVYQDETYYIEKPDAPQAQAPQATPTPRPTAPQPQPTPPPLAAEAQPPAGGDDDDAGVWTGPGAGDDGRDSTAA
jgi:hypothetical protein